MARARNIKPAFFDNDELAENDPLGRLLFIGLWTLADYQGNLEWRSKRIQKQLLAYDKCDIDKLAINLDKSGFIRFYSDGENLYVNIANFTKHQNPHKNERSKGSDIPSYSEDGRQLVDLKGLKINRDLSGLKPDNSDSNRADSLLLIPDSLNLNPDNKDLAVRPEQAQGSPVIYWMPLNDGTDFEITQEQFDKWSQLYQSVNIDLELRKMIGWLDANKSKRKTRKGFLRFANGWISKVQDSGGSKGFSQKQSSDNWHEDLGL